MTIQSKNDLAAMRAIGKLVAETLREMRAALAPRMTTAQLDEIGAKYLRRHGARSGPQLTYDFPGFNCISVNDEVVHGVPNDRPLAPGDVVKIDVTAELDGYIADAAITAVIPPVSRAAEKLVQSSQAAFERAFRVAKSGLRVSDLGRQVEPEVNRWGFSVIHDMCGHGVGRALHEQPSVPNFFSPFTPGVLSEGLVIALEPIICESPTDVGEGGGGWAGRAGGGGGAARGERAGV